MVKTRNNSEPKVEVVGNHWAESHGSGDRAGFIAFSGAIGNVIHKLGTCIILGLFPQVAVYMWHINEVCRGSLTELVDGFAKGGFSYLVDSYPRPSLTGLYYLLAFGAIQAFLQLALPGKTYKGPTTPKGNVPIYKANGVQAFLTTLLLFFLGWYYNIFDPAKVYDHTGAIISTSNLFSLVFCAFLYVKGNLAPSSSDSGSTGSLIFDFYWGMELFPRIGKHFDLKTWTNCRVGMMSWSVLTLCYAFKQYAAYGFLSNSMLISVTLTNIYIFKFYVWETGYWGSMDITHDRAGFYLCWGCLVWIPAIYTSPGMYMVRHPTQLPDALAAGLFVFGLAMIYINYDCDRQRQEFRRSAGKQKIWGKPPGMIKAKYMTGKGDVKESILLTTGWWGMARHFHYLPEILAAFSWSVSSGFNSPMAFVYVAFLSALLADRAYRDDIRCKAKYGVYWEKYCSIVPYKVLPYIF